MCVHAQSLSHAQFFEILWTVAHQVPLCLRSSGKNTGVDFHFLLQEIFPKPVSPEMAGRFFTTELPGKPKKRHTSKIPGRKTRNREQKEKP